MQRASTAALAIVLAACDCGGGATPDAGLDARPDASSDAGDGAIGPVPDAGEDAEEAARLWLEARCRRSVLCRDNAARHARDCHPTRRAMAHAAAIRALLAGDLIVDPDALDGCRAAAAAETCEEAVPCEVLAPNRRRGETCIHPESCVEGTCTGVTCPTTCVTGLGEGASCRSPGDCEEALTCIDGTCAPRTLEGAPCASPLECAPGTACEMICQPVREVDAGELCNTANRCRPWLICLDGTCVRGAGPGETCDASSPCQVETTCTEGRCVRRVLPGDACDPAVLCPRSHACVDGSCDPLPVSGAPCDAPGCLEGVCADGSCSLVDAGGACTDGAECRSGLCLGRSCAAAQRLGEPCTGPCEDGAACRFVPGEPRLCRESCE